MFRNRCVLGPYSQLAPQVAGLRRMLGKRARLHCHTDRPSPRATLELYRSGVRLLTNIAGGLHKSLATSSIATSKQSSLSSFLQAHRRRAAVRQSRRRRRHSRQRRSRRRSISRSTRGRLLPAIRTLTSKQRSSLLSRGRKYAMRSNR